MALQPTLRPFVLGNPAAPHTLDIFLDYVCPFSRKMTNNFNASVKPLIENGGKYDGKVKAIIRQQVQPWHGTSTYVHEVALAVARVSPEKFWEFHVALMNGQEDFFDIPSSNRTPTQTRVKLIELALPIVGEDKKEVLTDLLTHKTTPNGGTAVTDELKYTIKFSRQNSIHVSPTVLWDGLVANDISSSWGEKEWTAFLKSKVLI
ncbi:hypothetical protein BDM02DRAFT_3126781 [Thelephora ganbajun]|uniref:Uncharacterized protein n=1 Tax=Thelephora ganbajun TaxID=370292 RepID=A0ACB6ZQF7_THEGA|nr:hypothetical protein BDM02DRAFT_3126781 [Thelephora ganbajun]